MIATFSNMVLSSGVMSAQITVVPVEYPQPGAVHAGERLILDIREPGGVSESELREGLIELTGLTDCFLIEEKRTTFEWGASSESFELVVQIAQWGFNAIAAPALWAYTKHVTRNVRRRGIDYAEPTRDEAESHARYQVALSQGINADDLNLVGWESSRSEESWKSVITLETPTGECFTVRRTSNGEYGMTWIKPEGGG